MGPRGHTANLTLAHAYAVEVNPVGGAEREIVFPEGGGGDVRMTVKVEPEEGSPWLGRFVGGFPEPPAVSGVFSTPDPQTVCVVAAGRGFLVRTDKPDEWVELRTQPIVAVQCLAAEKVILFSDFTTISAYGPDGELWSSGRLSWDGLTILDVDHGVIRGKGWDAPNDCEVEFWIDLRTGKTEGGAAPPPGPRLVP